MKKNIIIVLLALLSLLLFTLLVRQDVPKSANEVESIVDAPTGNEAIQKKDDNEGLFKTEKKLDLSNQNLEKLPEYVLSKTNLEELDISNNKLSGALPAEIRHLQNLKVLNASNNNMTGVPAEVGQLRNLEVLDLSNNQLTGLPYELGNLGNLKILNLSGNDYAQQDLEVIKEGLPEDTEIIL